MDKCISLKLGRTGRLRWLLEDPWSRKGYRWKVINHEQDIYGRCIRYYKHFDSAKNEFVDTGK